LDADHPENGVLIPRRFTVATFGREMMLERQREGIAKAKTEGKYRGRKPTARARAAEIATLKADGVRPVDYCSSPRDR
jgi:DNA invertase Pin-like site-specific DNA recombinase